LLPAPTAPSEGSAGVRDLIRPKAFPSSILAHQLRRRFPSNRSPRRKALAHLLERAARRLASLSTGPAGARRQAVRCSAALLGMIAPLVPLCSSSFRRSRPSRVAKRRKIISSGASSRLVWSGSISLASRKTLHPRFPFHRLPAEIGTLVACRAVLPFPALWRGWDRRPDHPFLMRLATSRSKRKMRPEACG
jgi:hypothetical protein